MYATAFSYELENIITVLWSLTKLANIYVCRRVGTRHGVVISSYKCLHVEYIVLVFG